MEHSTSSTFPVGAGSENGPTVPERTRTRVLELVNALDIPIIDLQPVFQAQKDPLSLFPFRRFGHYNETGNQIVADTLLGFLSSHERDRLHTASVARVTPR